MAVEFNEKNVGDVVRKAANRVAITIELRARELVPVFSQKLKGSIASKVEVDPDGFTIVVGSPEKHGITMEYGQPPGTWPEEESIKKWSEAKGLPWYPVARKIYKKGIQVGTPKSPLRTPSGYRPFLRPAFFEMTQERINEILKKTFES
jgi:hypothetical protein